MNTYKIVRFYQNDRPSRVQRKNLTLEQAQLHCEDPETSSMTARAPRGCDQNEATIARWNAKQKHWFDGYTSN
jgi:hypothetical protein